MVTFCGGEESVSQICYEAKKLTQNVYVAVVTWMQRVVVVVVI